MYQSNSFSTWLNNEYQINRYTLVFMNELTSAHLSFLVWCHRIFFRQNSILVWNWPWNQSWPLLQFIWNSISNTIPCGEARFFKMYRANHRWTSGNEIWTMASYKSHPQFPLFFVLWKLVHWYAFDIVSVWATKQSGSTTNAIFSSFRSLCTRSHVSIAFATVSHCIRHK